MGQRAKDLLRAQCNPLSLSDIRCSFQPPRLNPDWMSACDGERSRVNVPQCASAEARCGVRVAECEWECSQGTMAAKKKREEKTKACCCSEKNSKPLIKGRFKLITRQPDYDVSIIQQIIFIIRSIRSTTRCLCGFQSNKPCDNLATFPSHCCHFKIWKPLLTSLGMWSVLDCRCWIFPKLDRVTPSFFLAFVSGS